MKSLWILGGGGHAKSVIDAARSSGEFKIAGVLDDSFETEGQYVLGTPVLGRINRETITRFGVENAVIAIGSNRVRERVARTFADLVSWHTVIHRFTYVSPGVTLGQGTVILAGVVIQPDVTIGDHVIANTSSSIGHDCVVEDFVHVAPGANLAGGAVLQTGAFMGVGSRIIPLKSVGAWSTVGAGSTVVKDIPDGVTAVGVPARALER